MERILTAAGLPAKVLNMIPDIVDTCRECRSWQKTGHDVTPSVQLVIEPNTQVEADIMFYKQYMAWRMLDKADRRHAGQDIY